jgi:glyoxylase-like metal-dependent hydrolase (beta-lactamase superfamily II)
MLKKALVLAIVLSVTVLIVVPALAQVSNPEWCRALPRPEYRSLERVPIRDPELAAWFEVYKPAPGVYAIYEPHQSEETISYLITGANEAILFDTGMGISNITKLVNELWTQQLVVLNSHTHNDHVGGNWRFATIYGVNTKFTRKNAKGSRTDAQAEITPGQICGSLPAGFDPKTYATLPWRISAHVKNGDQFKLVGRTIEVIATPGHTPDSISLIDRANGLLFTGDT